MNAVFSPLHRPVRPPLPASPVTPPQATGLAGPATRPQRIVSLHFPTLPTDRSHRGRHGGDWRSGAPDTPPLVHAAAERGAMRIVHADETALARGIRPGQALADARAAHPGLDVLPADPEADLRLLAAIADWCDRYTPLVALDRPDGLFLDITGCAHLFGGEKAMVADLLARLHAQGLAARAGVAASAGAAHAAARFSGRPALHLAAGQEAAALAPFPVGALRLDPATAAALARVGLKRIGDLLAMPRAPLARRFGRLVLDRLDQALGHLDEVLSPRLPVAPVSAERRLAEPLSRLEDVEAVLARLAAHAGADMEKRGSGARLLEYALFRADGAVQRLCVAASRPVRDPAVIARLFAERLAGLGNLPDPGCGYDLLRLSVLEEARLDPDQARFDGAGHHAGDIAMLLDRIAARLGQPDNEGAPAMPVWSLGARESHVPEHAEHPSRPGGGSAGADPVWQAARIAARPARLLRPAEPVEVVAEVPEGPPLRFRWRRALYQVSRAEGPERIEAEWWAADPAQAEAPVRDYYRVEDMEGRRFWLYRAGLYGPRGEGVHPCWFLHGIFA